MNEVRNLLIGYELGRLGSQISYYDRKTGEPVSVAAKVGSNDYVFPTALAKKSGKKVWKFGVEALYFATQTGYAAIDDLYEILENEESVNLDGKSYEPAELIAVFIRESLTLTGLADCLANTAHMTVTVEKLTGPVIRNLRKAFELMGLSRDACAILDRTESFYYYAFSQKSEIWSRKMALFHFDGNTVSFRSLEADRMSRPILVKPVIGESLELPELAADRDRAFLNYARSYMEGQMYSAVFLTGEGFDKEWAGASVSYLCRSGRHVFFGRNLYVRGACYTSYDKKERNALKGFLYLGPDLVRTNVSMEVLVRGNTSGYALVEAGRNWFDEDDDIEIILDDRDFLAFTISAIDGKNRRMLRMELPGLPERPNRMTRLRISVVCPDPSKCVVTVKDMGFGGFYEPSGLEWTDEIIF